MWRRIMKIKQKLCRIYFSAPARFSNIYSEKFEPGCVHVFLSPNWHIEMRLINFMFWAYLIPSSRLAAQVLCLNNIFSIAPKQ